MKLLETSIFYEERKIMFWTFIVKEEHKKYEAKCKNCFSYFNPIIIDDNRMLDMWITEEGSIVCSPKCKKDLEKKEKEEKK